MHKNELVDISVGTSIQLTYQKMDQSLEQIFKELIDNSTQSFFDNREELNKIGIDKCIVKIEIKEDEITITDNAYGMNKEQFGRALRLNSRPKNPKKGSRNQFGMGLKYSAINLGDEYTIQTTTLGSDEMYSGTIKKEDLDADVNQVVNRISIVDVNDHFTKISIRRLRRENITDKILEDLMSKLGRIYRRNLHNNDLTIEFVNVGEVEHIDPELEINEDGSEYLIDFSETVYANGQGYEVNGWVGILKTASTAEFGDAGFSLVKDDRIVILNYRPKVIFGSANSFPYQRITGEIVVNDFPDNFNKAGFDWDQGLQVAFLDTLRKNEKIMDLVKISKKLRKSNLNFKPKQVQIEKTNKEIQDEYAPLKTVERTVIHEIKEDPVPIYMENIIKDIKPITFEFEGRKYNFFVVYDDEQKEWFDIKDLKNGDRYIISINNNFKLFKKINKASNDIIQKIIIIIVTAELSSSSSGQFNHSQIRRKINELMSLLYAE